MRFYSPHFEFLTQFSLRFDEFRFGFQTVLDLFVSKLGNTASGMHPGDPTKRSY